MHRSWRADLVGMTAMPEARLAREAEMCCALLAFATDYDCWREAGGERSKEALLTEIIGHVKVATERAVEALRGAVAVLAAAAAPTCECQHALKLGIWSRRDAIAPEEIARLGPLVARYLG